VTFENIFEDVSYTETIDAIRNLINRGVTPEEYVLAYQIAANIERKKEQTV